MKQNLSKDRSDPGNCNAASCRKCPDCKVISLEEKKEELKDHSSQLYAREAEHYFFYYALNMKQSS